MYPFEVPGIEMTHKPHKLYVHVLESRVRVELLNIGNAVTGAYLVEDRTPLDVRTYRTCEGDAMVEVELPPRLQARAHYCVCLETAEPEPVYEPIRK